MTGLKVGDKVTFNMLSENDVDREEGRIKEIDRKMVIVEKQDGSKCYFVIGGSLIKSFRKK